MNSVELVTELTDICIRQAEIIRVQADVLAQFGAVIQEDKSLQSRLYALTGK